MWQTQRQSCLPSGKGHQVPFQICVYPHFCDPCSKIFLDTQHGQCRSKKGGKLLLCSMAARQVCHSSPFWRARLPDSPMVMPCRIHHCVCAKAIFPIDYLQSVIEHGGGTNADSAQELSICLRYLELLYSLRSFLPNSPSFLFLHRCQICIMV